MCEAVLVPLWKTVAGSGAAFVGAKVKTETFIDLCTCTLRPYVNGNV